MGKSIKVSTPSRICLFGEHQDYLGLEVIASAIDLRFYASATERKDAIIRILIRDESINALNEKNHSSMYQEIMIDASKPIVYDNNRDYLKSAINVLLRNGYAIEHGFDIVMDSDIPIGKGMSSSTTMIIVFIKLLLEMIDSKDKDNAEKIAQLSFDAEVTEFDEPGGMMDHFASALGGIVHLKFSNNTIEVNRIDREIPGCFIIFDSLERKNTTKVLSDAKIPVLQALEDLKEKGITGISDFINNDNNTKYLDYLEEKKRIKLCANINNHIILKKAEHLLNSQDFSPELFGQLLKEHHKNLRDGLNISTPTVERILNMAYKHGALGGKINGSGGGGCAFVYSLDGDCVRILQAVKELGYPGKVVKPAKGVQVEKEEVQL